MSKPFLKGRTFYICIGKSGGFRFEYEKNILIRLCLWKISFAYMKLDLEILLDKIKGI